MKKITYINANYALSQDTEDIKEGGFSRNYHIMNWIQSNAKNLNEIKIRNGVIIGYLKIIFADCKIKCNKLKKIEP